MQEILAAQPGAQRALFRRYHIGGCQSCGYKADDVLEEVALRHNITNVDEVLDFLESTRQLERLEMNPRDVATAVRGANPPRLIDVRTPDEWALAGIEGATLMTETLAEEMMRWSKDSHIVFFCHFGQRSLDAATYFAGHGFKNMYSMKGGIDAWSVEVDESVPRYRATTAVGHDGNAVRPLRSVVSQAAGCKR
jgi:rhodanese-related sulfurtransferase